MPFPPQINGCINYLLHGNNGTIQSGKQQALRGDSPEPPYISCSRCSTPKLLDKDQEIVNIERCWPTQKGIQLWMLITWWQNIWFAHSIYLNYGFNYLFYLLCISKYSSHLEWDTGCALGLFSDSETALCASHCFTLAPDVHKVLLFLHSFRICTLSQLEEWHALPNQLWTQDVFLVTVSHHCLVYFTDGWWLAVYLLNCGSRPSIKEVTPSGAILQIS